MKGPSCPLTKKLWLILSDGKWHRKEVLVVRVGVEVSSGVAYRIWQKIIENQRRRRGYQGYQRQHERPVEAQIVSARRQLVFDTMNKLRRRDRIIEKEVGGMKLIRKRQEW